MVLVGNYCHCIFIYSQKHHCQNAATNKDKVQINSIQITINCFLKVKTIVSAIVITSAKKLED
jgi:hypothetical protein